jgi:hypothetical protein
MASVGESPGGVMARHLSGNPTNQELALVRKAVAGHYRNSQQTTFDGFFRGSKRLGGSLANC